MTPHDAIGMLVEGRRLSEHEAGELFTLILTGALEEGQVAAVLALVQARGVTVDELVGAARVMRTHVTPVPRPTGLGGAVIDTCGTGGAPKSCNVSTGAAIVAGAARGRDGRRVYVAKHGNRSRTGRGSAEVLAALGVNVDASPEVQATCLERAGVCFCFAIHHHPAMRHAAGARRALGVATMFNLLGPMTNPAGADRQLLGVYAPGLVELVAGALARLGAAHAIVAHGLDGMDELSSAAPSLVATVRGGVVERGEVHPASLGIAAPAPGALVARDAAHSAEMLRGVLRGERGPVRDIVALNAAAALVVGGMAGSLAEALPLAFEAIDSGRAGEVLRVLAEASKARDGSSA